MATIRAYTTIEQSKKLAEILPLESADMVFLSEESLIPKVKYNGMAFFNSDEEIPTTLIHCWSLSALLDVLEGEIDGEEGETYQLNIEKDGTWWNVWYKEQYDEAEPIETESTEDLVDACYSLIIKLHELNLL